MGEPLDTYDYLESLLQRMKSEPGHSTVEDLIIDFLDELLEKMKRDEVMFAKAAEIFKQITESNSEIFAKLNAAYLKGKE